MNDYNWLTVGVNTVKDGRYSKTISADSNIDANSGVVVAESDSQHVL